MTLRKDEDKRPTEQTRGQKIAMFCIFGIVALMAIAAAIIFFVSGTSMF